MRALFIIPFVLMFGLVAAMAADGLVTLDSPHSAAVTADRLVAAVEAAGAAVFARIDHAAAAASIGEELEPTVLLIFGNPKIGMAVIQADRRAGLDLPIRALIWEEDGATKLAYLDGAGLEARYGVEGADEALARISVALRKLTGAAVAAE